MSMRLLKKQEIEQAKAQERARAVQEGLGLANRVDVLRETQATEEASLGEFRAKTVSAIQTEADDLTNQRDQLTNEVLGLEQRKTEALVPLDSEWQKVQAAQEALRLEREALERDQSDLADGKALLAADRTVYEIDCKLLKEGRDEVEVLLAKAHVIDEEARSNRADAQQKLTDAEEYRKRVEKELGNRDWAITATAERQKKRDTEQDEREIALNTRTTLMEDREKMELRDIIRKK